MEPWRIPKIIEDSGKFKIYIVSLRNFTVINYLVSSMETTTFKDFKIRKNHITS